MGSSLYCSLGISPAYEDNNSTMELNLNNIIFLVHLSCEFAGWLLQITGTFTAVAGTSVFSYIFLFSFSLFIAHYMVAFVLKDHDSCYWGVLSCMVSFTSALLWSMNSVGDSAKAYDTGYEIIVVILLWVNFACYAYNTVMGYLNK